MEQNTIGITDLSLGLGFLCYIKTENFLLNYMHSLGLGILKIYAENTK